jgi:hypothetical protein
MEEAPVEALALPPPPRHPDSDGVAISYYSYLLPRLPVTVNITYM